MKKVIILLLILFAIIGCRQAAGIARKEAREKEIRTVSASTTEATAEKQTANTINTIGEVEKTHNEQKEISTYTENLTINYAQNMQTDTATSKPAISAISITRKITEARTQSITEEMNLLRTEITEKIKESYKLQVDSINKAHEKEKIKLKQAKQNYLLLLLIGASIPLLIYFFIRMRKKIFKMLYI